MTEILAPAGNEQCAYAALHAGADAVYLGLTRFSAREGAENFCVSALEALTRTAHLLGAKVYVALNTLVKDEELPAFFAAGFLKDDRDFHSAERKPRYSLISLPLYGIRAVLSTRLPRVTYFSAIFPYNG